MIFLVAGVAIVLSGQAVRGALDEIVRVEEPMRAAPFEMEINAVEIRRDVLEYTQAGDPRYRERFADDRADFGRSKASYDELVDTRTGREQGERIGSLYRRISETNVAFASMFGYEPRELVGMGVLELVTPGSWETVRSYISSGFGEPYEAVVRKKDGTTFEAEIRGSGSSYRGRAVRVTAMRDKSERKRAEDQSYAEDPDGSPNLTPTHTTNCEPGNEPPMTLPFDTTAGMHTYRFDFFPNSVAFYADGHLTKEWTDGLPSNHMRLLLNAW